MTDATRFHLLTRCFLLFLTFFSLSALARHHKRSADSAIHIHASSINLRDAPPSTNSTVQRRDAVSSNGYCDLHIIAQSPYPGGPASVTVQSQSETVNSPWYSVGVASTGDYAIHFDFMPKSPEGYVYLSLYDLSPSGCQLGTYFQYNELHDGIVQFCNPSPAAGYPPVGGGCGYYHYNYGPNEIDYTDWICPYPC